MRISIPLDPLPFTVKLLLKVGEKLNEGSEYRTCAKRTKLTRSGPVEFNGGRCTAPLTYYLYGDGELSKYEEGGSGYFAEVHILAGIGNKPGGGGEISIENMWFRIYSLDDPEDSGIPLLVP